MTLKDKLCQAAVAHDRRQVKSRFYNPNGLAIALERIDEVMADVERGAHPRDALMAGFNGRLLTLMLRAAGLADFTAEEMLSQPMVYTPHET